jgi:hypothetical protein
LRRLHAAIEHELARAALAAQPKEK